MKKISKSKLRYIFKAGIFIVAALLLVPNITASAKSRGWNNDIGRIGPDGPINAIAVVNFNDIIVGGEFTSAGGLSVDNIAWWDINERTWRDFTKPDGNHLYGKVNALVVYYDEIIAGGDFIVGDLAQGGVNIARFNAATGSWTGLDSYGIGWGESGSEVKTLTVFNGKLIVGGSFTKAGTVMTNNVAYWYGQSWHAMPGISAEQGGYVSALTTYNGQLIAGGRFDGFFGSNANFIARYDWNQHTWTALLPNQPIQSGLDFNPDFWHTSINALTVYNNELIIGGHFSKTIDAQGHVVYNIIRWDGMCFKSMGNLTAFIDGSSSRVKSTVYALQVFDNTVVVGGFFVYANPDSNGQSLIAHNIASWSSQGPAGRWFRFGSNEYYNGASDTVLALSRYGYYPGCLYVGGLFNQVGNNLDSHYIARWQ